jgi:endonuclease YncB( thermonuclease family)
MMVQMGMARDCAKYSGDYYQFEEDIAKKEKRGIWAGAEDGKTAPNNPTISNAVE